MDAFDIIALLTTSLSVLFTFFTIIIHLLLKDLLHHPGHLVFIQCVCQLMSSLHWYTTLKSASSYYSDNEMQCEIIGVVAVISSVMFFDYLLALSLEIVIKLKHSTGVIYKTRNRIYHIYSLATSCIFSSIGIITKQFGLSPSGTCSLHHGPLRLAYMMFLFANIICIWIIVLYVWKDVKKNSSSLMFSYVMVVLSVSITITISQTIDLLEYFFKISSASRDTAIIFGSLTGTCISLSRLLNKTLLRKLKSYFSTNENINSSDQAISLLEFQKSSFEASSTFSEFFQNITRQTLSRIITLVYLRFSEQLSETSLLEEGYEYKEFKFTEKEYAEIVMEEYENFEYLKGHLHKNTIREYLPELFKRIREDCIIKDKDIHESMILHMNNLSYNKQEGGGSDAFIFTTYDEKFVVKTVTSKEKRVFIRMSERYGQRIFDCKESKLIRILGLFKVMPGNVNFIIMENAIPNKDKAIIFDLKGSLIDRVVGNSLGIARGIILKDQNFVESNLKVGLSECALEHIKKVIKEDFDLLRKEKVMDYSLLLAFYDGDGKKFNRYSLQTGKYMCNIAIIDILQEYNLSKMSEKKLKSIYKKNPDKMSVAEPNTYYNRILWFTMDIFVEEQV
ncbi:hypothetical protein SteCoe_29393 [Stentor coeruleus]|uniref:PIPK domain-containing protein n=1 Tax=Stentor coeruleus TaxID=5963 RepID=A0A1R2B621_9CILI|nr:hypothetical protein SteCoe_29393 [Stentor coeruleus]